MKKRIVAIMLAATLVSSLLVGCGGGDKSSKVAKTEEKKDPTPAVEEDDGMWADYQVDLTNKLSNPNATDKTKAIYNWLCSIQGQYIVSGLQEKCGDTSSPEFQYLKEKTEDFPGLRGLDFINGDYEGVTTRAIFWSKMDALISICWHMGVPGSVDAGYDSSKETVDGLAEAMDDPNSDLYKQIVEDIDKAVPYLKEMQDNNVVVLWRPFHEFNGKWFWWGKGGAETFVKLWRLMYDRYTNVYGLNNLIWVLGYSGSGVGSADAWYPGDDCVDIIGADTYNNGMAGDGYAAMFDDLANMETSKNAGKPYTLHECGRIPSVGGLTGNKVAWLWFLVWHSGYIDNPDNNDEGYVLANFSTDYYLNLSELPHFNKKLGIDTGRKGR